MCVCQFLKWNICLYADGTDTGEGEKLIISERGVKVSWSRHRVEMGKICCMGASVGVWSGTSPPL